MSLFRRLLDDAAIFPPGNLPLPEAVRAHTAHHKAAYADLVGPLVLRAADLSRLAPLVAGLAPGSIELSLITPLPDLPDAVARLEAIPAVTLASVEAPPGPISTPLRGAHVPVYVEVPRDGSRDGVLAAIAHAGLRAKLRTGGVRADLHPGEAELAQAVVAVVRAGVPFKATAGLHHAVRNTDPATGFEQHGFLNLLVATAAAANGADPSDVARMLAERDPDAVAAAVRGVDPSVREWFRSFGTCSIAEPVDELARLGLLPAAAVAR